MGRATRLRSRMPGWQVTATTIGVIIAVGAAVVAKWPHAWWWLVAVTAAAAVAVPLALGTVSDVAQRRGEAARTARAALIGTTGAAGSKLPAATSAALEARVHPTVLAIPYIRRDQEEVICGHLRAGRPVLLVGSSMVGKTRMAAQVISREFGDRPAVVPDSKTALAELDARDIALRDSVIWLDDIDRLIGAGGITDGALRRLVAAGNIIMGTIRAKAYDRFRPSDQLRPPEWDVLGVFERIVISRDLTSDEQERLASAVNDPSIRERIRAVGIGEYVGGAGQIAEALKLGEAGTDTIGYALLLGAADWRRCGMTRPVPASMLASLAEPHLDQRGQARLADQDAYRAGLDWATRDINPNVSLLQPAGTGCYSVYDYALDLISQQGTPIPASSWDVIITQANAYELIELGYTAGITYHHTNTAIQAFRKAASSRDANEAPMAAVNLGVLLAEQGDADGAKAAYQQAIDSGHPDQAPKAAFNLGVLLEEPGGYRGREGGLPAGDRLRARRPGADGRRQPGEPAPQPGGSRGGEGGLPAGDRLRPPRPGAKGRVQPGEAAGRAGRCGRREGGLPAGDRLRARRRGADGRGQPGGAAGRARGCRGREGGLPAGDRLRPRRPCAGGRRQPGGAAGRARGCRGREGGLPAGDRLRPPRPGAGSRRQPGGAANRAGGRRGGEGGLPASDRLRPPRPCADGGCQPGGAAGRAGRRRGGEGGLPAGDRLRARRPCAGSRRQPRGAAGKPGGYRRREGGLPAGDRLRPPRPCPAAAFNLGVLLESQEDAAGAKAAFQQAIDSGHADVAPMAAVNLGVLLAEQGDTAGARAAFQQAIDSGDPDQAPKATRLLNELP